ncbi:recombinase family protein [Anaerotignum neopropionicum]|uniref:recombinase family protein n=1 Tax=Anaerotignum neopropionicum TaxID=36847 RepID=UPI002FE5FF82
MQRQNGKLKEWSGHFVRQILDNPVYCGKIAFGRRAREKVKGTKNQYRQAWQEDYILADGQHEASSLLVDIIAPAYERVWEILVSIRKKKFYIF